MPKSDSSTEETNAGNNLYIANLSYNISEGDLHDKFAVFGKIRHCRIIRDPVTQESRGFGFVTFESAPDANEAIS